MKTQPKDKNDIFVDAAQKAVKKAGWSARYDLEIIAPDGSRKSKSTSYGYKADKVRLVNPPDLLHQVAKVLQLVGTAGISSPDDAFYDVVASRVYLQTGSFKVCPYSAYDYYEIREACADGLRSAGATEPEVIDYTVPVTSLFIASVVTGVYALEGPDPAAFRRGWSLDHLVWSVSTEMMLKAYVALYANVQLRLWSDNTRLTEALRTRSPCPFDALQFETDRGIAILLDTFEFAGLERDGLALDGENGLGETIIDELKYNWRSWPIKAFQWAEMLASYIISDQKGRQIPQQLPQNIAGDRPSTGARERRNLVRPGTPRATQNLPNLPNQFNSQLPGVSIDPFAERVVNDPQFRRRLIEIGIGNGKRPIIQPFDFESLDVLYSTRVAKVEIESKVTHKKGMALEISHMTREELDDALPNFSGIDWGATRTNQDGSLRLYKKKLPINDQTPAKLEIGSFPDLLFIVDSSGSMGWNPSEGTGPYDSLLRATYSVFDFLERNRKAQYMQFAVVNFSNTTLTTPWCQFAELRKVKEALFKYQGGGTVLDCTAVQQTIRASKDKFLCLMMTDAQIGNANNVFDTIQLMTTQGHGFVLIQIGSPSPLTLQVQQFGLAVHIITDHRQLEGLCLDYAQRAW